MSFVKSFFQEISTVFSDHYMHMGGDEVTYDCWKQDPSIATWMAKNNIAGTPEMRPNHLFKFIV